jgi:hypothetical protein
MAAALLGCGGDEERFLAVTSEQPGVLYSAFVATDGTAYLAGGVPGGGAGLLLKWDGRSVVAIPTGGAHAFWWIHGTADDDMWLAGELGEVHRFDGRTLTRVEAGAPPQSTLFGIWGASSDDVWAVGGSFVAGGPRRVIRRLVGGSWSDVPSPADVDADTTYFKVWGAGAADVWIVGDRGVVLRDQGQGPARVAAPGAERYVTVHGCGAGDVHVVGGGGTGTAVHFDGGGWTSIPLLDVPPLAGLVCTGGAAYVGGFFGYAARIAAGVPRVLPLPSHLRDLAIHGMAVGAGGRRVLAVGGDLVAVAPSPPRGFAVELRR